MYLKITYFYSKLKYNILKKKIDNFYHIREIKMMMMIGHELDVQDNAIAGEDVVTRDKD